MLINIQINSLMSGVPAFLGVDSTLFDVIKIMNIEKCSCVVIIEDDQLVGIITERDIVGAVYGLNAENMCSRRVVELMSSPVVTIEENQSLFEALVISQAHKIRHLPVINSSGSLVGVIIQADLVKAHFTIIEHEAEIIEKMVDDRTKELVESNEHLKTLSLEDALMKIGNRRAMEVDLLHTHSAAIRYGSPYSIALFDIDWFKLYNDHYGHLDGDKLLKKVSDFLKISVRESDRIYRYGGEEILLLMSKTEGEEAFLIANRIVADLGSLGIPHDAVPLKYLTISCGVSTFLTSENDMDVAHTTWHHVVEMADKGLYQAKGTGRNRVAVADNEN